MNASEVTGHWLIEADLYVTNGVTLQVGEAAAEAADFPTGAGRFSRGSEGKGPGGIHVSPLTFRGLTPLGESQPRRDAELYISLFPRSYRHTSLGCIS